MSITSSECGSVAIGIQHVMRMHRIVICDLSGCNIFFHTILYVARFSKEVIDYKISVFIVYTTFVFNRIHPVVLYQYNPIIVRL